MGHLNDAQTFGIMRRIGTECAFLSSAFHWVKKITLMVIANYDALNCSAVGTKIGQNEMKM